MGVDLKVLFVEDSEDDAVLLLRRLRKGGYDPTWERVDTPQDMEAALDGASWDLVISDHSDWDELCSTILETGAGEVWVTHGQEDALVHWCVTQGIRAKPLHMLGYGDEEGDITSPLVGEVERTGGAPGEGGGAILTG